MSQTTQRSPRNGVGIAFWDSLVFVPCKYVDSSGRAQQEAVNRGLILLRMNIVLFGGIINHTRWIQKCAIIPGSLINTVTPTETLRKRISLSHVQ